MERFEVVVVGGGPAGLMAAFRASELGFKVILLEKNANLGVKLLMTGGGRCNFTNNSSIENFSDSLGFNGRWFISSLSRFGPEDTIDFFKSRGIETKVENDNKVFPVSDQAKDILNIFISCLKENGVKILTNSKVEKVIKDDNLISKIVLSNGKEIFADKFIFACGGKSRPTSGSSGEVYNWLSYLGHKIIEPKPALSEIFIKEDLSNLEGLSFSDIFVFAKGLNFKSSKLIGDIIFTKNGFSGPVALNLSRELNRQNNDLNIFLDFFPEKNKDELKLEIKSLIENNKNFNIKNVLSLLITKRFSSYLLDKIGIDISKKSVLVSKLEIELIVDSLKSSKFNFLGIGDFSEAMISSGGVSLKEVNNKTMNSKIISNLYLAGETLDLDGPTGGYNLQIAWTSGYLAGGSF